MKKIILLVICLLFITGCGAKYSTITADEAKELIDNGATIIDVREISEYNQDHIENAINIPLGTISTIDLEKDTIIILYCASGKRSKEAALKLVNMGYTNVYNLDGGLINWGFEGE